MADSILVSLAEIETELDRMAPEELRHLALMSWRAFLQKQGRGINECDEEDPRVLAALDKALAEADATPGKGLSGDGVRARLAQWTTK